MLIDRYQHHTSDEPVGVAVAKAAIDWQRAGMPPGSVDRPTSRELTDLTLLEVAPNRVLSDDEFDAGLDWATAEVAAFAALVRREPAGSSDEVERYRAFDAVVSWARANADPVRPDVWEFVVERATGRDRLAVGTAAYLFKSLSSRAMRSIEPP